MSPLAAVLRACKLSGQQLVGVLVSRKHQERFSRSALRCRNTAKKYFRKTTFDSVASGTRFDVTVNTENPNVFGDIGEDLIDKGLITLPKGYTSNGTPVKLLIYGHGGGGYVDDVFSESESDNYCKFMSSLGYAILDMNGIPAELSKRLNIDRGRTVGSFVALRSYIAGYKFVIENFNIDPNGCYFFANSNGGLMCLNLANLSDIPFVAQAGIAPAISIERNLWFYNAGTLALAGGQFKSFQNRANIIRLFGMSDVSDQEKLNNKIYEKDKVGAYDPFEYLMFELKTDYSVPFMIFQAKDDLAVFYEVTKNFVTTMNKRGDNISLREFETGGHQPEPQKGIVGKYQYKVKIYSLTPTVLEVAKWFEGKQGYKVNYDYLH